MLKRGALAFALTRFFPQFILPALFLASLACGPSRPATPLETFKTYIKAIKQKDTAAMKVLLSAATMKMHAQQARAQSTTVDEIVARETLISEGQKTVEFRDEKIEGDKATLEVKNSYGTWETVPFVREEGDWKIDKQGYVDRMLEDAEKSNREIDALINGDPSPTPIY